MIEVLLIVQLVQDLKNSQEYCDNQQDIVTNLEQYKNMTTRDKKKKQKKVIRYLINNNVEIKKISAKKSRIKKIVVFKQIVQKDRHNKKKMMGYKNGCTIFSKFIKFNDNQNNIYLHYCALFQSTFFCIFLLPCSFMFQVKYSLLCFRQGFDWGCHYFRNIVYQLGLFFLIILGMRNTRSKSCFQIVNISRKHSSQSIRPQSALLLKLNPSTLSNTKSIYSPSQINRSPSSLWRAVSAARCQKHLNKQTIQPIRKNLSEKKIRLQAKRSEQQQKYKKTIDTIRKKCESSCLHNKARFEEANILIGKWLDERGMEKNRYLTRLSKLKG